VPHVPPITSFCVHPTNRLCHTKYSYQVSSRPCNAVTSKLLTADNNNSNPSFCATDSLFVRLGVEPPPPPPQTLMTRSH
jgi:hypothetical protein